MPLEGDYQFVIHAPQIHDRVGNPLGAADIIRSFRVGNIVRVPTIHWIGTANGFWDDVNNWDAGRLPGEMDDVEINVPGDVTVTFRNTALAGEPPFTSTIRSLVSSNALSIIGGALKVTETMQVNNTFTLHGQFSFDGSGIATLSALVLRGTAGQGLTIGGYSRLEACNIQTDISLATDLKDFRIKGGLNYLGTLALKGLVYFEGTQTITQGTFLFDASAPTTITPIGGDATVTLGADVSVRGTGGHFLDSFIDGSRLTLINYGRIIADASLVTQGDQIEIQTTGFMNHGILEVHQGSNVNWNFLSIDAITWTNAADGQIRAIDGGRMALGFRNSLSWSNAGSISATNRSRIDFYAGLSSQLNVRWSNTGSIFSQDSTLLIGGMFSSADVENLRRSGGVVGFTYGCTWDNTGHTFTFDDSKGSWELGDISAKIIGGTLVLNTPVATLDIYRGTFDGVTVNGLLEVGADHQGLGAGFENSVLAVVNGLTINGTVVATFNTGQPSGGILAFHGAQTVHGGVFSTLLMQSDDGQVTFDTDVTMKNCHVAAGTLFGGSFLNLGTMLVEAQQTASTSDGCVNRGLIQVLRDGFFGFGGTNEGMIMVDHGSLSLGAGNEVWHNHGTINAVAATIDASSTYSPSDFGDFHNPGGTVHLGGTLDLGNGTLDITPDMCEQWILAGGLIVSGTIRIEPGVTVSGDINFSSTLKDVTIDGNIAPAALTLAGDITLHGTVKLEGVVYPNLTLGNWRLLPNLPLTIHSGIFDLSGGQQKLIQADPQGDADMSSGDITFGPDVVIHGGNVKATFVKPLLNLGQIIADPPPFLGANTGITFTNATITNRGTLTANGAALEIDHLAANEGTILARTGGRMIIGGDLTQTTTGIVNVELGGTTTDQIGQIQVSGNATLAGTLQVTLVNGFAPQAGNTFPIISFSSRIGTFATVVGWDPPRGVVYDALDVMLVA